MPLEFQYYQQHHADSYRTLLTKLAQSNDADHTYKYYYSLAEKEGNWFGSHTINLILRQAIAPNEAIILFYQKNLQLDKHHRYLPSQQPINAIDLLDVKMIARQQKRVTVAFLTEKNSLQEWNLVFERSRLAEQWEALIRDKKNEAVKQKKLSEDKQNIIQELISTIRKLQNELLELQKQCDSLLQENGHLKHEAIHFKELVHNLENQLLQCKAHSSVSYQLAEVKERALKNGKDCEENGQLVKLKVQFHQTEQLLQKVLVELADGKDRGRLSQVSSDLTPKLEQLLCCLRVYVCSGCSSVH